MSMIFNSWHMISSSLNDQAYQDYLKDQEEPELPLPGLKYSADQLFWLGYATVCSRFVIYLPFNQIHWRSFSLFLESDPDSDLIGLVPQGEDREQSQDCQQGKSFSSRHSGQWSYQEFGTFRPVIQMSDGIQDEPGGKVYHLVTRTLEVIFQHYFIMSKC